MLVQTLVIICINVRQKANFREGREGERTGQDKVGGERRDARNQFPWEKIHFQDFTVRCVTDGIPK